MSEREECEEKHKVLNWIVGVIFASIALLFSITTYSLSTSLATAKDIGEVRTEIETHKATGEADFRYLKDTLKEMKADIREIKNKVK